VYTKDLTFLLRLLQSSKQSGILFVEAPEQDGANDSSWQGQFQLENGVVKFCKVLDTRKGSVLFINDEAINWLISQGRLKWRIVEEDIQPLIKMLPASSMPSNPTPSTIQPYERIQVDRQSTDSMQASLLWEKRRREVFQRTLRGNSALVNAFPSRDHRQVFALVDGRRNIEEIVQLLHKPPDVILRLLQELYMAGFIL